VNPLIQELPEVLISFINSTWHQAVLENRKKAKAANALMVGWVLVISLKFNSMNRKKQIFLRSPDQRPGQPGNDRLKKCYF